MPHTAALTPVPTATTPASGEPHQRRRAVGNLSLAFLSDQFALGVAGLASRDSLLVLAINQANVILLTKDPEARRRYGAVGAAAPDAERRPVSVSRIAASLNLPYETVRRRVHELERRGVCHSLDGGVIVPEAYLTSPEYVACILAAHERLRGFWRDLVAADLLQPLPGPSYAPDEGTPVRAAARILADYLLRSAEHLLPIAGDATSTVLLLGMLGLNTAVDPDPVAAANPVRRAVPMRELAERLGLPAETARRHAKGLAERRRCARTRGGYIVTEESLQCPDWRTFFEVNMANVQRLFAALAERGVIAAWERAGAAPG
jgi:DNA-binding Lrp family transcriptional regulator